jgi:hypothetical protein
MEWGGGMKCRVLCLAILLLASTTAMGQIDPDADGIGLYWDEGANEVCRSIDAGMATLYVAITNPSGSGAIAGWECANPVCEGLPAGTNLVDFAAYGDAMGNFPFCPDFSYGLGSPLPWGPVVLLAELVFQVQYPACAEFYIRPVVEGGGGWLDYMTTQDMGQLIQLHPSSGDCDLPVAQLNCDCTVVESSFATWGGVKTMYR